MKMSNQNVFIKHFEHFQKTEIKYSKLQEQRVRSSMITEHMAVLLEVYVVSVSWPGNLNWGKLLRSPPPYKRWSLVISSVRFFWYAGPASTTPPAALRHKPEEPVQTGESAAGTVIYEYECGTHLLLVLYSRILSRKSFCTGSRSLALLKTTADRPMFLRSVTLTAERNRDERWKSRWRAMIYTQTHTQHCAEDHLRPTQTSKTHSRSETAHSLIPIQCVWQMSALYQRGVK